MNNINLDNLKVLIAAARIGLSSMAEKVPSQVLLNVVISIVEGEKYISDVSNKKETNDIPKE